MPDEHDDEYYEEDEYEDEEDEEEDDDEAGFLPADHKLLQRFQKKLTEQLTTTDERLTLELREKSADLKAKKKHREDIGVELYGVQQQLARLQLALEDTHDRFHALYSDRQNADENLQKAQQAHEERKAFLDEQRGKFQKFQGELDQLNATVRQVEQYNDQMKGEIAVTRRATYKAEENVTTLEKEKETQDHLIDSLNQQLKDLREQLASYDAQLLSQKAETQAASTTLAEAVAEMEGIQFEKKYLMQQWKSSLIGMTRRDEALQATEDALRKQHEQELLIDSEVNACKNAIKSEKEQNEKLTSVLQKLQSEADYLQSQIAGIHQKRDSVNERYSKLKKSLEQIDEEMARVQQHKRILEHELAAIEKTALKIHSDTQALDENILQNLNMQTTIQKSSKNVAGHVDKVRSQIRDKEMEAGKLQNELARIRVDALNTTAHNQALQQTLDELLKELDDKELLIEKYEQEIRRRHDMIEKKQQTVDKLNRRFDSLTKNQDVDENTGPLEATINSLQKEINGKATEYQFLQREWIKNQTELVAMVNNANSQGEKVLELKSQETILDQKRLRLDGSHNAQMREMKELKRGIANLHNEMSKLNELISRHGELQGELANKNFNLETEFVAKLKDLEVESVTRETRVHSLKEEKEQILEDIVEAERQIMQWEKKIELERETQATLDPETGDGEREGMRKEIHRMELRLKQLKRKQEEMIVNMERAIQQREHISNKGRLPSKATGVTQAAIKKSISTLKKNIKKSVTDANTYEQNLRQLELLQNDRNMEIDELQAAINEAHDKLGELEAQVGKANVSKRLNLDELRRVQQNAKRYQAVAEKKYNLQNSAEVIENEINKQTDRMEKLHRVLDSVSREFPHLQEELLLFCQ